MGADNGNAAKEEPVKPLVIDDLLELPRPGTSTTNAAGTFALWPSTQFDFSTSSTAKTISLVDLDPKADNSPRTILTDLSFAEFAWLDQTSFVFLRLPGEELAAARTIAALTKGQSAPPAFSPDANRIDQQRGLKDSEQAELIKTLKGLAGDKTEVWIKDVLSGDEYHVGSLPVAPANLKIQLASKKEALLFFSASVFADGDPYTVAEQEKKRKAEAAGSDARVYDKLFARHWDEWIDQDKLQQLHWVRLSKAPGEDGAVSDDGFEHVDVPELKPGKWSFVGRTDGEHDLAIKKPKITSPLSGTGLECPVGPFGGAGDFSTSLTHIVFHAKDPHVNPAWHTRTQVYTIPLAPKSTKDAEPKRITIGNQGACSGPVFSPDGKRIAWSEMRKDGYESDRNRIVIYEVASGLRWGATEKWDRSATHLTWSASGETLYFTAEESAQVKLWSLDVPIPIVGAAIHVTEPTALTHRHSVSSVSPIASKKLLLTINSLTSPNVIYTLDLSTPSAPEPLASLTPSLAKSTYLDQGEIFAYAGALGKQVEGFVFYPPGTKNGSFKRSGKKLPLAVLIHGGPQGAWTDSWSTRWNPNIFASHGYITVTLNPTGSTGYGQDFVDAIQGEWGGLPFQDIVAGVEFVKTAYPEIDAERTAMLGASYGGYQANWIQGHNDILNFKAIVCHDGVFSTQNTWYNGDELYFPEQDFGGKPWEVPEAYSKWNPQNHISKWKTPQLVIHNRRDYRLTESEGLGVFNTLQRLGVPSRFLQFDSENHWVLSSPNGRRWHQEVLRWIDEWTADPEAKQTGVHKTGSTGSLTN